MYKAVSRFPDSCTLVCDAMQRFDTLAMFARPERMPASTVEIVLSVRRAISKAASPTTNDLANSSKFSVVVVTVVDGTAVVVTSDAADGTAVVVTSDAAADGLKNGADPCGLVVVVGMS